MYRPYQYEIDNNGTIRKLVKRPLLAIPQKSFGNLTLVVKGPNLAESIVALFEQKPQLSREKRSVKQIKKERKIARAILLAQRRVEQLTEIGAPQNWLQFIKWLKDECQIAIWGQLKRVIYENIVLQAFFGKQAVLLPI